MELIIAEKANAAERISDILSGGNYSTRNLNGVTVYEWDNQACVGLSGHVVEVDFTEDYNDWGAVEPSELIDAELKKRPSRKNIVSAVKQLAGEADRAVIATDYDSEGELIGKEAYELIKDEADVPVDRVRFSSLTPGEVRGAFEDRDELDFDLAAAGEARQIIDLIWGAALTRYLSLASKRLGDSYLSVGRVQSPTLKILVDREKEIEEFDPEPYWEIYADLLKEERVVESQYFYRDDGKEQERIWDGNVAESVFNTVESAGDAWVESVDTRTRNDYPPPPFDTTQFIRAAGAIGFSASRAMSLAEDLYTQGFISYPRTDNTVYPDDIEPRGVLEMLAKHDEFKDASELLEDSLTPTSGDKETTDHPPIYPTALVYPDEVGDDEWRVYELVVRRFLATFAEPAEWEHIKAVFDVAGESFKANGKRLLEPGYHAYYPYFNTSENRLPPLEEGESLEVHDVELEEKETQPPNRIGQSKLVEKMEERGIGTKSTRHNTIQKLYDRGYVEQSPPRPTALARSVIQAMEEYAELVTDPEMTERLERDMKRIAEGEVGEDEVMDESREMLDRIFEILEEKEDEIGESLREGLKEDRTLGECPECGGALVVRRARRGSYFVGCDEYPDCTNTYPLPNRGKAVLTDDECEEHGLREVRMLDGRNTFVHGCPICKVEEAEEEDEEVIGECPDCGDTEGGELAIKRTRSGGRLVGCTRYPDCEYSLPLPRRGDIEVTDVLCDEHGLPELVVHSGSEPWELGCPICNYRNYKEEQQKKNGLQGIEGIGEATAEKLRAADIESVEDLQEADPEELAEEIDNVSASRIREWQSA